MNRALSGASVEEARGCACTRTHTSDQLGPDEPGGIKATVYNTGKLISSDSGGKKEGGRERGTEDRAGLELDRLRFSCQTSYLLVM